MGARVQGGPGDDPDEYWFTCDDCDGTGEVRVPDQEDPERASVSAVCPVCDGVGVIEGDASDV